MSLTRSKSPSNIGRTASFNFLASEAETEVSSNVCIFEDSYVSNGAKSRFCSQDSGLGNGMNWHVEEVYRPTLLDFIFPSSNTNHLGCTATRFNTRLEGARLLPNGRLR